MRQQQLAGAALGAVVVLCWSGYNVAAKHGIDIGMSPQALAFLRFSVPGVIGIPLLAILFLRGWRVGVSLTKLTVLVLLGGPLFGLIAVSGYVHAPLSHGLLFAPVAVFVMGGYLGSVLLREPMSYSRLIGAAVMFAGLVVLTGFDVRSLGPTWGHGAVLFVVAGFMWGGYTVLLRLWNIPMIEGGMAVAAGSAMVAGPCLGPYAISSLASVSSFDLALQIVMQGLVGGLFSVVALIGAVRLLPTQTAALLPAFTPAVALILALMVFGQMPSAAEIAGVAIIALGFVMSCLKPVRTRVVQ